MLFRLIEALLYDFDIKIAEILPEQIINFMPRLSDFIILQQLCCPERGFFYTLQYPSVHRQKPAFLPGIRLFKILQLQDGKLCRIVQLIEEPFGYFQILLAEKSVGSKLAVGSPVTDCIRGMGMD